jgi:hypothetical protein
MDNESAKVDIASGREPNNTPKWTNYFIRPLRDVAAQYAYIGSGARSPVVESLPSRATDMQHKARSCGPWLVAVRCHLLPAMAAVALLIAISYEFYPRT